MAEPRVADLEASGSAAGAGAGSATACGIRRPEDCERPEPDVGMSCALSFALSIASWPSAASRAGDSFRRAEAGRSLEAAECALDCASSLMSCAVSMSA